jgi:hypothetical protein
MKEICAILFSFLMTAFLSLPGQAQNPRNVWIDDVTSTNCGHCPCMDSILMQHVLVQHPKTSIIQIHGPLSNYETPSLTHIVDSLNFQMPGTILINRQNLYATQEETVDSVNFVYNTSPEAPVKLEILTKSFNSSTRELSVSIRATSLVSNPDGLFRINLMVTEGNLIGWQQHFPECPGGDNYNHQNVLRAIAAGFTGDTLITGPWATQQSVTWNKSLTLDTAWIPLNCTFLVYVDKKMGPLHKSPIQQSIHQNVEAPLGVIPGTDRPAGIVSVFPNPVHGIANVHILIKEPGLTTISLQTINGKKVRERLFPAIGPGSYNLEFDTAELPAGIYILTVITGPTTSSQTIQIL